MILRVQRCLPDDKNNAELVCGTLSRDVLPIVDKSFMVGVVCSAKKGECQILHKSKYYRRFEKRSLPPDICSVVVSIIDVVV